MNPTHHIPALVSAAHGPAAKKQVPAKSHWFMHLLISCCMASILSAAQFGDFTYTDNGTSITITDYPTTAVGAVSIPATIIGKPVTAIGVKAFQSCSGLTSVTIPNSINTIGGDAFNKCTSLINVTIPYSINTIGNYAFQECDSLVAITVDVLNSFYSSENGLLFNKDKTTLIQYPGGKSGSYSIPDTVTDIMIYAFAHCGSLTSVTIPNTVTTIRSCAFYDCTNLTSVKIGTGVNSIGSWAFRWCTNLTSITIPNSVTSIEGSTFDGCTSLTSVTIGASVTSIGNYAFDGCERLTSITIPNSVTSIGNYAFYVCHELASATFQGNAPSMGGFVFDGAATGFKVYYYKGKAGFTSPTWMGYPAVAIDSLPAPEIAVEQPAGKGLADGGAGVGFGSVALGANASRTFTIKNTGTANLTGLTITRNGPNAAEFIVTTKPASSVAGPTGSTTFSVRFAPGAAGTRKAAIHIASNDANENPFDITLTGTGIASPEIAVQQRPETDLKDGVSAVSFGKVAVKKTVTKTFTIRNTGTATLNNLAVTKNGKSAKNFRVKAPLKKSLAPGASTTFKVTFKPTAKGTRKAVIHIRSNDGNENPFDITLTGKGKTKAKSVASSSMARAARLPSRTNLNPSKSPAEILREIRRTISTVRLADGRKYLALTIAKSPGYSVFKPTVEVSPNLVDWYSGGKHTTVIADDATFLKVRDNTPLAPEIKRYIRLTGMGVK